MNIPILADGDTGFGYAIMLEDQTFPKRCGHVENTEIVSKAQRVQKIEAAVDARDDGELRLLARPDARANEGLEGALLDRASPLRHSVLAVEAEAIPCSRGASGPLPVAGRASCDHRPHPASRRRRGADADETAREGQPNAAARAPQGQRSLIGRGTVRVD